MNERACFRTSVLASIGLLLCLSAAAAFAQTAVAETAPPRLGPVLAVSGSADESLSCTLVFAPALEALFEDSSAPAADRSAHDRYANVEVNYLLVDSRDSDAPIVVGSLWNGVDAPPASQVGFMFNPEELTSTRSVHLHVDRVDLLAGPDFTLFCDVLLEDEQAPVLRKIPGLGKPGDVASRRGGISILPGVTAYALKHLPLGDDAEVKIELAYTRDPNAPDEPCPAIEVAAVAVDATTLRPLSADALVTAELAPGGTFGHAIGILHEHQNPTDAPVVPTLIALDLRARQAAGPHCSVVPLVEVRHRGTTSNLEVQTWRSGVVE